MYRKIMIGLILLAMSGIVTACAAPRQSTNVEAKTYTIKASYETEPSHPKSVWAEDFKAKAEELSGGRLQVLTYPSGQLYKDEPAAIEAVTTGVIQMVFPATSHIATIVPQYEIFNLPFLFTSKELLFEFEDSDLGKEMLTSLLAPKGLKGLGWTTNVSLTIWGTKKGYVSLSDLKGAKIRLSGGAVREASLKALGASTVSIPHGEVYLAAQQGVIDGALTSLTGVASAKQYEVMRHVTNQEIFAAPYPSLINLAFWNNLPDDLKKVAQKAADYATKQNRLKLDQIIQNDLKKIRDAGVTEHELSPADIEAWRNALKPIYDQARPLLGTEWMDRVVKFIKQNS